MFRTCAMLRGSDLGSMRMASGWAAHSAAWQPQPLSPAAACPSPGYVLAQRMLVCAGQHTLTITKVTDSKKGVAWLQSIELGPAGSFLPPPPTPGMRSGRRMLFLGDSFT